MLFDGSVRRRKLITAIEAAGILNMAETTFRQKCNGMGLPPVDLNAALPPGSPLLKDHWRWVEDEIVAYVERAIAKRDKEQAELRRVMSGEKRKLKG